MGQVVPAEKRHEIAAAAAAEIREGASYREMAEKYGIPVKTLHRWVLSECGDKYHELQTECLIARVVEADEELRNADTPLAVSRSREVCKFMRWDLERRRPERFGLKTEVTANVHTSEMDPAEAARRIRFVLARAAAQDAEEAK